MVISHTELQQAPFVQGCPGAQVPSSCSLRSRVDEEAHRVRGADTLFCNASMLSNCTDEFDGGENLALYRVSLRPEDWEFAIPARTSATSHPPASRELF